MSHQDDRFDRPDDSELRSEKRLDEALAGLRSDEPSAAETEAVLARAWQRLEAAADAPAGGACADLRADLGAWREGRLPEARSLLLQAHARECVPCRRALKDEVAAPVSARPVASGASGGAGRWRWAAAAAVLAGAVGLGAFLKDALPALDGAATGAATLVELDGTLFSPGSEGHETLVAGAAIPSGRWLRTGKGARALLELADGSRVEVNERSQLLVRENQGATTVRLSRGDVIVQAAKRGRRDLFVETDEMTVAVKGTIFTVEHGLKGSRVGVLEGSVQVESGREGSPLLVPGQQLASRRGLTDRALRDQVAWSRQFSEYRALLDELEAVQASLAERPFEHRLRHSTDLLDAMPEGTVFYAALPNSSANLRRFVELVTERFEQSPELARWWDRLAERQRADGQPTFDEMLDVVERLSASLGDEVVVALVLPQEPGSAPAPMMIARVRDETQLRSLVDAEIGARVRADGGRFAGLGDAASLRAAAADGSELHLAAAGGAVVAGPSAPALLAAVESLERGTSGFAGSSFHRALGAEYRRGAETLVAFDLESLVGRQGQLADFGDSAGPVLQAAGFDGLKHFLLRSAPDEAGSAVLSFREDRRGLASWLAEPAPMGSLEFVSPRATVVLSAVFKDPAVMLRDLQQIAGSEDFGRQIEEFRRATGVDPFDDLAAPLGGEMTVALDGPLFPSPAWKVVLETYDPVKLQQSIELLVRRHSEWAAEQASARGLSEPAQRLTLNTVPETDGPRHVLRLDGLPTEVHYTFSDGYLVAAGSSHRLAAALEDRTVGATILGSPAFTEALPQDERQHFSLIAWQNLGPAVGLLLQGFGQQLPAGQTLSAGELDTACLLHARAGERDIEFSVSSSGAGPGAHLAALLRRGLAEGLQHAAERGLLGATSASSPGADDRPTTETPDSLRSY